MYKQKVILEDKCNHFFKQESSDYLKTKVKTLL